MDFKKNDKYTLKITDIGVNGEGIGKKDGFTVFVSGALPGETVEVLLVKVKKHFAYGKLLRIITPSKKRTKPVCPAADKCGGCSIQHLAYPAQLEYKQNLVKENLQRIGGFDNITVLSVKGMDDPYFYRNKGQYPIKIDKNGINIGFYARGSHRVINCQKCYIAHPSNEKIISAVRAFMQKNAVSAYDEESHKGIMRHVLIRNGAKTGEIMVCPVVNCKKFKYKQEFIDAVKDIPNIKSVVINYNCEKTNVILGSRCETIMGSDNISDYIGSLRFNISPLSFFQVNPIQTEKLYNTVLDFADLNGNETVIDAYCGTGTITLFLAQKAKQVYGIEIIPQAIENAKINAAENHIQNAEFFCGRSEDIVPDLYSERNVQPDVIVVDPPRKGCEKSLLELMLKMLPKRIVYVSCDSATLARDLKILCEDNKYKIEKVQPVDMFPHSVHIETVVLLSQRNPDEHIDIELDLDELDVTKAEKKPTYDQIKDYVFEKHGLKVTSLYIAQVKKQCGLAVGESYNKPKSDNARVPVCPQDKADAIIEALRYFKAIS